MPQHQRRPWGVMTLAAALAATLAMTVEIAAPPPTSAGTDAQVAAAKKRRTPPNVVWSRHAAVMDPETGELLFAKDADRQVPIASITKLMTCIVFLEQEPDLSRKVKVTRKEKRGGGRTQLLSGEWVKLGDLLHMSLMCSDNVATRVIVRESGLTLDAFLLAMNRKAKLLGMTRSRFVETTGLDAGNVSTAADVARLVKASMHVTRIQSISTKRQYDFATRARWHTIPNTNRLLASQYEIKGGKTGYIGVAGYCFATWLETGGREMIAVVLNAPTAATRFADVKRLVRRTLKQDVASRS